MTDLETYLVDERIRAAITELKQRIEQRYPDVVFDLYAHDEPEGVYLRATVDIDDIDEVIDLVIDRLVDMHIEGLPVHVIPAMTPARNAALIAENLLVQERRRIA